MKKSFTKRRTKRQKRVSCPDHGTGKFAGMTWRERISVAFGSCDEKQMLEPLW